ncbi:MAG: hypothetical protein AAGF32_07090 [Pseudomonadota bacterium]
MNGENTGAAGPAVGPVRRAFLLALVVIAALLSLHAILTAQVAPGAEFTGRIALGIVLAGVTFSAIWLLARTWFASRGAALVAVVVAATLGWVAPAGALSLGQGLAVLLIVAASALVPEATLSNTHFRRFALSLSAGCLAALAACAAPQLALLGPVAVLLLIGCLLCAPGPRQRSLRAIRDDTLANAGFAHAASILIVGAGLTLGLGVVAIAVLVGLEHGPTPISDLLTGQFRVHGQLLVERDRVLAGVQGADGLAMLAREIPIVRLVVPEPQAGHMAGPLAGTLPTAGSVTALAPAAEPALSHAAGTGLLSLRALLAGGGLLMVPALFAVPGIAARANRTLEDRRLMVIAVLVFAAAISNGLLGPGTGLHASVAVLLPALVFAHIARSL